MREIAAAAEERDEASWPWAESTLRNLKKFKQLCDRHSIELREFGLVEEMETAVGDYRKALDGIRSVTGLRSE